MGGGGGGLTSVAGIGGNEKLKPVYRATILAAYTTGQPDYIIQLFFRTLIFEQKKKGCF